jgi:predicted extracellular nuclease
MRRVFLVLCAIASFAATAPAEMRITEWMYDGQIGSKGEYVEFTNVGSSAIDMNGWSFDDDSRAPGTVSLSAYGTVAAGESVILTDATIANFRTSWGLADTVKIIGGNGANLGRDDEINLFDSSGTLVDRLTFGDDTLFPGTIRARYFGGNPGSPSVLGTNNVADWVLSSVGDGYGSWKSNNNDVGNPGRYTPAPEPTSIALALIGLASLIGFRRRWL